MSDQDIGRFRAQAEECQLQAERSAREWIKLPEDAERWPWITPVAGRRQVPVARGIPLHRLGLTGQSLRNGHCRMPVGGFPTAVDYLTN